MTKTWWQSKTLWVNVLTFVILLLSEVQGVITDPGTLQVMGMVIAVVNIILRVMTTTKLEWGDTDESME